MPQPSIFISCVTSEFGQTRGRVADILTRLGFIPVKQEIFGTEAGDLRQVLRDKIDACNGLIQIVGQGYGAEPPTVDAEFGRVSYTQFEFLYARKQGKVTWLIMAGEGCTRDNPVSALDLPWDKGVEDPLAYQAERRELQAAYRQERQKDGHLFHLAMGDADLLLRVEQLKNELEQLRRSENQWRKNVSRLLAGLFVLLVLIAVGVWWKSDQFMRWVYQDSKPTESRVREHLTEREEKNYQDALLAAEKIENPEERRKYLADVEEQHNARLHRIHSLVENFESLSSGSHASVVLEELSSIISTQGEAAGVKYMEPLQAGIWERVESRPASAHQENRDDLLPLLIMALLQASEGELQKSNAVFDRILKLEPDWPDARYFHFWYLITSSEQALGKNDPKTAERALLKAQGTVEYSLKLDPGSGQIKHDQVLVFNRLGDFYDQQGEPEKATEQYQESLKIARDLSETIRSNPTGKKEISFALNRLGNVAFKQQDYILADKYFSESLEIAEELAASDRWRESSQYDLMFTLRRMGDTALALDQTDRAKRYILRSLGISEQLAGRYPSDAFYKQELSMSLELAGDILLIRDEAPAAELAFERLLSVNRDLVLIHRKDTQETRNLSVALNKLSKTKKLLKKYEEAEFLIDESIEIMERLAKPEPENRRLRQDLLVPWKLKGEIAQLAKNFSEAEKADRRSLELARTLAADEPENDHFQYDLVKSQSDLAATLLQSENLGQDKLQEAKKLLIETLPIFEKFLSKPLPDQAIADWKREQSVVYNRLADVAWREKDYDEVKAAGERSLEIIRSVVALRPGAYNREQDLIYTLRHLGQFALDREEFEAAEQYAREVLDIRHQQATRYRDSAAQHEIAFAHFELAKIANRKKDDLAENRHLQACYQILKSIRDNKEELFPPLSDLYPHLEQRFGKDSAKVPQPE